MSLKSLSSEEKLNRVRVAEREKEAPEHQRKLEGFGFGDVHGSGFRAYTQRVRVPK